MRFTLPILLALSCAAEDFSLDLYLMGVSRHTNRYIEYNEENYGAGLGVTWQREKTPGVTFATGAYLDSYAEVARYAVLGPTFMAGSKQGVHAALTMTAGYLEGSDHSGFGLLPFLSFGYNRVSVCALGMSGSRLGEQPVSQNPRENRKVQSGFVAVFLKIRLLDF